MKAAERNRQFLQLALHKYVPCVLLFLAPVLVSHFVAGKQGRVIVLNQSWPFAWEYNPPVPLAGVRTAWNSTRMGILQPTGPSTRPLSCSLPCAAGLLLTSVP